MRLLLDFFRFSFVADFDFSRKTFKDRKSFEMDRASSQKYFLLDT
jgi:hypothetical protein